MGENSKIEWTDHTFNPWVGCQKVSPGCKFCYAERDFTRKPRWANTWGPPETSERIRTSDANWRKPLAWDRQAQAEGRRYRVFCASLADVFEDNPQVADWRADLWDLIELTPNLDWLLLTKRPENIGRFVPERWIESGLPRNIWFGTSAEDQGQFERRWNTLDGETHYLYPTVLFLSLEPLLGPIDIEMALVDDNLGDEEHDWWTHPVDWVIAGGESGPHARPCHSDWVRQLRDQCQEAGVAFFFKQWGAWKPGQEGTEDFGPVEVGERNIWNGGNVCRMYRVGKKAAGRLLDGREWSEFPDVP